MTTRKPAPLRAQINNLAARHGWNVHPVRPDWPATEIYERGFDRVAVAFTPKGTKVKGGMVDTETTDTPARRDIVANVTQLRALITRPPATPDELAAIELRHARELAARDDVRHRAARTYAQEQRARVERLESQVAELAARATESADHVRYLENRALLTPALDELADHVADAIGM